MESAIHVLLELSVVTIRAIETEGASSFGVVLNDPEPLSALVPRVVSVVGLDFVKRIQDSNLP